jgi:hypothetical protein
LFSNKWSSPAQRPTSSWYRAIGCIRLGSLAELPEPLHELRQFLSLLVRQPGRVEGDAGQLRVRTLLDVVERATRRVLISGTSLLHVPHCSPYGRAVDGGPKVAAADLRLGRVDGIDQPPDLLHDLGSYRSRVEVCDLSSLLLELLQERSVGEIEQVSVLRSRHTVVLLRLRSAGGLATSAPPTLFGGLVLLRVPLNIHDPPRPRALTQLPGLAFDTGDNTLPVQNT